jgi:hypothetical protein
VVAVRGNGDSLGTRNLHGIQSRGKRVFKLWALVWRKLPEHVSDHVSRFAGADADLETRKNIGSEMLEDRFDAVVSAC